jgi:hypothetical protein
MRLALLYSLLLAYALIASDALMRAQEPPAQPQPAQQSGPAGESASTQSQSNSKHTNDFLVRGTVFTQEGLALPGAELHIRRSSEKKFKWHDASNSRGEFAIRVKMGASYEVVVRAKGYQEQSQAVDAATGERFKDLVFRMHHQAGKKS